MPLLPNEFIQAKVEWEICDAKVHIYTGFGASKKNVDKSNRWWQVAYVKHAHGK